MGSIACAKQLHIAADSFAGIARAIESVRLPRAFSIAAVPSQPLTKQRRWRRCRSCSGCVLSTDGLCVVEMMTLCFAALARDAAV
jgi:hypothetical protein